MFSLQLVSCKQQEKEMGLPNIVFLLVDDLGYMDLGCYGSTFYETPHIDRLAGEGMLFTEAYAAAAVCSPTRASILTGKYPSRVNITDWIPGSDPQDKPLLGADDLDELPHEEVTLAEYLKDLGYMNGFIGKWHLGGKGFLPQTQGFDINIGGHAAGQPASYFYPYKNDRKFWDVPGLEGGKEGEYLTDRLTDEAISFMDSNKEDPFFLYFCYYNVHTPIQAKDSLIGKYQKKLGDGYESPEDEADHDAFTKISQDNPTYAAMVHSVDESVGRIMDYLKEIGEEDNTIIIFTSDNGGLTTLGTAGRAPTSVRPLRAGKGWLYEGGIKVPAMLKFPGKIPAGSNSSSPIISMDYFPTIAEMIGEDIDSDNLDGIGLTKAFEQKKIVSRNLYWHFPHYHGSKNRPVSAVRSGNYKLMHWHEDDKLELYNLSIDPSERMDMSEKLILKRDSLKLLLENWKTENNASMPTVNPKYK
ncbi:MAG: sulfatase [Saprospiraceae bacterium]|nr:sulfatase [Saprospiraceae bacterium]